MKATQHYWTAIETDRHLLHARVRSVNTEDLPVLQALWQASARRSARDAYDLACGKETPRQIRAYAIGYKKLFPPVKSAAPATQPSQDVHEEEEA